jgi:DNA polymerase-3 subunit epsilon
VIEARLIRAHSPPYNRAQRGRAAQWWLRLSDEIFPRLVSSRNEGGLGPLSSRAASAVREALEEATDIRTCSPRITRRTRFAVCVRGQIGRCPAPCDGAIDREGYAPVVAPVARALSGDPADVLDVLSERIERLAGGARYEEAAGVRDRLGALVEAVRTARAVRALRGSVLELAIGDRRLVVDHAFLKIEEGEPAIDGHPDEPRLISAWLWRNRDRVRPLRCEGELASRVAGGRALAAWAERLRRLRLVAEP